MICILNYKLVKKSSIGMMFDMYLESLTGVYDDFLETHILDSEFYSINYKGVDIGYFAILEKELLTQFFITENYLHIAQNCFKDILDKYGFKNAFVPTCDELFLSVAMDFKKEVNLQAYFFKETDRDVAPPSYPKTMLRLAILSDAEVIKSLSGDFFDEIYQQISDRKIYILENGEDIYGFGIMEKNIIHKGYSGTGVFTVEEHRQKGVGRSIILHLKDLCHTLGYKALPGCWYYNHNSKRTLESCGFITKTRLLKIEF